MSIRGCASFKLVELLKYNEFKIFVFAVIWLVFSAAPLASQGQEGLTQGLSSEAILEGLEGETEAGQAFLVGVLHFYQNESEEALKQLNRSLSLDPNCLEAYLLRGICHLQLDGMEEAGADFERYILRAGEKEDSYNVVGKLLYVYGFLDEAELFFRKGLALNPENAVMLSNLGSVLVELNNFDEAKECFNKAIELDDTMSEVHVNLGMLYFIVEDFAAAESAFLNAIALNEEAQVMDPTVYANLGDLYFVTRKMDKAIQTYQTALGIDPELSDIRTRYGMALEIKGEHALACEQYTVAVSQGNAPPEAHLHLADFMLKGGRIFEAMTEYRNAIKQSGHQDPEPILSLAQILLRMEHHEEAYAWFRRAFELGEQAPRLLATLSMLAEVNGHALEAVQYFQMLKQADQDSLMVRLETAHRCATSDLPGIRDMELALNMARALAVETEWKHPGVLEVLALAFAGMGDYPSAAKAESRAIDTLDSDHPLVYSMKTRLDEYLNMTE